MKLPDFDYICPTSLGEALNILKEGDGNAIIIAGGQSLVPILAFRLAAPELLVDIRNVPGLRDMAISEDAIEMGALVRWRDIARSEEIRRALPLLPAAIEHVAHYQIQNRGTIGGSLAHADPAAEFPGLCVTCDAIITIANPQGEREVPAADLLVGPLETSLAPGDMIVRVRFPAWHASRRWAFEEFSRRRGDFAIAAIAAFYDLAADGTVENAHIGVMGASDIARRLAQAEARLNGRVLDERSIEDAASAASAEVEPPSDFHGSAEYRKSLVATLLSRSLTRTMAQGPQ